MTETKKAAISLLVAALVFILTAFSSAQAWEGAAELAVDPTAASTEEMSLETLEESEAPAETETLEESEAPAETETLEETHETETVAEETAVQETVEGETETETEMETEGSVEVVDYFANQFMVTVTGKTALNVSGEVLILSAIGLHLPVKVTGGTTGLQI